jgi:tol-pal system protein YbgF
MKSIRIGMVIAVMIGLIGCGNEEEMLKVKRDLANLQEDIYELQRDQEDMRNQLQEKLQSMEAAVADRTSQAEVLDQIFTLRETVSRQEAQLQDLENRLARVRRTSQTVRTAPTETENIDSAPPSAPSSNQISGSDVENQYNAAMLDFQRGKFAVAVLGFEEIVQSFPSSPQAQGATYYLGRCHYEKEDWSKAVSQFERVQTKWPSGSFVRQAMYYQGECYYRMNAHSKAVWILRELKDKYPGTQEAELAKNFLEKVGYAR